MKITLIAAVSDDGFISRGTGVPWDLPLDKAHFRSRTAGKWLLVGRTTYQEMTGWFSDHRPLIVSQNAAFVPAVGQRVGSAREGVEAARAAGAQELMVIGGGQLYTAAMPYATHLDLTRVHDCLGGGVRFPVMDFAEWRLVSEVPHAADEGHRQAFTITEWERRPRNASEV